MKNTLVSLPEILVKGSKNIKRPHPQYLTTIPPLVITSKLENFSIVGKEDQNLKRAIKEAMYIKANDPSLNRNVGKYLLPHIWDEVLFDIPELKIT